MCFNKRVISTKKSRDKPKRRLKNKRLTYKMMKFLCRREKRNKLHVQGLSFADTQELLELKNINQSQVYWGECESISLT